MAALIYQKFGFNGPILEFDRIGLKYKNKRIFTWDELYNFRVKELSSYFPINTLNCYGKKGVKLLSLDRKFIALPDDVTVDSLLQLMKYFDTRYSCSNGGKNMNAKVESELGTTLTH